MRLLRFQYSLRTLCLFVGFGGAALGWLGYWYRSSGGPLAKRNRLYGKFEVEMLIGDSKEVAAFFHNCAPMQDGDLVCIEDLAEAGFDLDELNIPGAPINGSGLKYLQWAPNLTGLYIADTRVTSDALVHVSRLKLLGWLDLTRTNVDDEGLAFLAKSKGLKWLCLRETNVLTMASNT